MPSTGETIVAREISAAICRACARADAASSRADETLGGLQACCHRAVGALRDDRRVECGLVRAHVSRIYVGEGLLRLKRLRRKNPCAL